MELSDDVQARRVVTRPSGTALSSPGLPPALFANHKPSFSPIAKLPVEVLRMVFYHIVISPDPLDRDPRILTHVCRHWRLVAYNYKEWWTYVPMCSTTWTEHALTISHPLPIKFVASPYADDGISEDNVRRALDLSRMQEIVLLKDGYYMDEAEDICPHNFSIVLGEMELHAAPLLQVMVVKGTYGDSNDFIDIPDPILQECTPLSLRALTLEYCTLCMNESVLLSPSLKHLSLTFCNNTYLWDDWEDFQYILGECAPNVETLVLFWDNLPQDLDGLDQDDASEDFPPCKTILPFLRELRVIDKVYRLDGMLRTVTFPPRCHLFLSKSEIQPTDSLPFADTLRAYYGLAFANDAISFTHLRVFKPATDEYWHNSEGEVGFELSIKDQYARSPQVIPLLSVVLQSAQESKLFRDSDEDYVPTYLNGHPVTYTEFAVDILATFSEEHCAFSDLVIDLPDVISAVLWRTIAGFARNITTMDICSSGSLYGFLTAVTIHSGTFSQELFLFPALEELRAMKEVDFRRPTAPHGWSLGEFLVRFYKWRILCRHPLREFMATDCIGIPNLGWELQVWMDRRAEATS
ncbi:hypothetical protein BV25DRAFT_1421577 [Artomyces pyxidatus]|uniref:Uncharacterized protein n=1 Tax=Artomyces pyxidatus TaxID=48021 RepID=A0ACB8TE81_9AGAM|nr:hypothetical protein BV25DRAFT_1421577 [Artomyces pyxidatus]